MMRTWPSIRSGGLWVAFLTMLTAGCAGPAPQPPPATPILPAASPVASPAASPIVVPASSPVPATPVATPSESHTVAEGETLASIAEKYYEDGAQWRKIYEANREAIGDNPDSIKIGQTLKIPPRESSE